MKKYSLITHGGAGNITNLSDEKRQSYLDGLKECLGEGQKMLSLGRKSLDVVERCVNIMEDNKIFNAGRGSVINAEGEIEMDASIMDGSNLMSGSVIGLKHYKNPVSVARAVMERTEHVMLAGEGAEEFANKSGFKYFKNNFFKTEARIRQAEEAKKRKKTVLDIDDLNKNKKMGTVGAVAYDLKGDIAAATSTGGIANKLKGRVGDSPIIGAGIYASNKLAGVSATGFGEQFIRCVVSFYAAMQISDICQAPGACRIAMDYLRESVKGLGGIIMIDRLGNIGCGATCKNLIHGYIGSSAELFTSLTPSS